MTISSFINTTNAAPNAKFKISTNPELEINEMREIESKFSVTLSQDITMQGNFLNPQKNILFLVAFLFIQPLLAQHPTKQAIVKYLSQLSHNKTKRVISGQFESWGSSVRPLNDTANIANIIHKKTGKWVGLIGAEYQTGQQVNYQNTNQLFIEQWNKGGFCQLYLIMTNPCNPTSFNGGGRCDMNAVLDSKHAYNKYFYAELDKVAVGLKELQQKGVVVFLNMFAEATANWFWWGGGKPADFIALFRNAHDYLVKTKGLTNLLFVYEPSCSDNLALQYYPGRKYVDMIGFSLFIDYDKLLDTSNIQYYQQLKKLGKPLAISQWGPRRGQDQTQSADQPPADNLKLIQGIQKYYPEIVWWMNWNYAYSICTPSKSNYNGKELLNNPWVINRDEIKVH